MKRTFASDIVSSIVMVALMFGLVSCSNANATGVITEKDAQASCVGNANGWVNFYLYLDSGEFVSVDGDVYNEYQVGDKYP